MTVLGAVHRHCIHGRRVRVLTSHLSGLVPGNAAVLDVGCGDGLLASALADARPDLSIRGVDVLVRENTRIPVEPFDGRRLPYPDRSFDAVLLIDVLHHTDDPETVLAECTRVSRRTIVIKDHKLEGFLSRPTLRVMDWIGNARYGVRLPYNYWPESRWRTTFTTLGVSTDTWLQDLKLYPRPIDWLFGRSLHFIARLETAGAGERAAGMAAKPWHTEGLSRCRGRSL